MIHGKAPAGWEGPQPCEDRIATLEAALRELRAHVGEGIRDEMTMSEIDDEVERLAIIDKALETP